MTRILDKWSTIKSGLESVSLSVRNGVRNKSLRLSRKDITSDTKFMDVYHRCKSYTMTSMERMYGLYQAVRFAANRDIPGDIVECGVWRGGSSMLCALTLLECGKSSRRIYLYDTFEGMTAPTSEDANFRGESAGEVLKRQGMSDMGDWCHASLEDVKANMLRTGYPADKVIFVKGPVEETIPSTIPEQIALLRLDTDWYESTYHELVYLFPRLSACGALILDDYGHWQGARKATDKYFSESGVELLMSRLDYTGRISIKV